MSGTLGTLFKVTSFGESHSKGIGVITDGCPPGIYINKANIQLIGGRGLQPRPHVHVGITGVLPLVFG
jgi:chorismate synthase